MSDAAAGTGCAAHAEDIGRAADDGTLRGKGRRISFFDEMTSQEGETRSPYREYCGWFEAEEAARIQHKTQQAEALFRTTGITFNVYGAADGDERLIPFDVVPRIISASEWRRLSRGIEQRVRALNAFLYDIYHRQEKESYSISIFFLIS